MSGGRQLSRQRPPDKDRVLRGGPSCSQTAHSQGGEAAWLGNRTHGARAGVSSRAEARARFLPLVSDPRRKPCS